MDNQLAMQKIKELIDYMHRSDIETAPFAFEILTYMALDKAIKSMYKLEKIKQILEEMDPLNTIIRIRDVLEQDS